jgi:hypothetical protein
MSTPFKALRIGTYATLAAMVILTLGSYAFAAIPQGFLAIS